MVSQLKTAVELGRWEDGTKLTPEQTESAMQAVMLWQAQHQKNDQSEPFVVGADGELFTGKGESHLMGSSSVVDEKNIIAKNKV